MFLKNRKEIIEKMKKLEDGHEPIKLTFREFIEICLIQYSILIPLSIGITFIFFLVLIFITKVL